jgi:hypothetical protein
MDDGQLVKNGGITLCTDNYTLDEVDLMIKALMDRYNLKWPQGRPLPPSIHYKKGKSERVYYRIYIGKKSFDELKPLILPHVIPSFQYKLHL